MHKKWVGVKRAKGKKNCGGNVGWCWKVVKTWDLLSAAQWACCNLNKNRVGFWPKFLYAEFKFGLEVFAVVVLRALCKYEDLSVQGEDASLLNWGYVVLLLHALWKRPGESACLLQMCEIPARLLGGSVYDLDFQTGLHFKAVVSFWSFFMEAVF